MSSPFVAVADGVVVTLKVTPRARHAGIDGLAALAEEGGRGGQASAALKVRVTAPPEDGKANAAVIDLLARSWHLPKRDLTLVTGAADRLKRFHIAGEPDALKARLEAALEPAP